MKPISPYIKPYANVNSRQEDPSINASAGPQETSFLGDYLPWVVFLVKYTCPAAQASPAFRSNGDQVLAFVN